MSIGNVIKSFTNFFTLMAPLSPRAQDFTQTTLGLLSQELAHLGSAFTFVRPSRYPHLWWILRWPHLYVWSALWNSTHFWILSNCHSVVLGAVVVYISTFYSDSCYLGFIIAWVFCRFPSKSSGKIAHMFLLWLCPLTRKMGGWFFSLFLDFSIEMYIENYNFLEIYSV